MLSAIDRGMLARDIGVVTLLKDRIPIEGSNKAECSSSLEFSGNKTIDQASNLYEWRSRYIEKAVVKQTPQSTHQASYPPKSASATLAQMHQTGKKSPPPFFFT